jgi:hypothetical protein
MNKWIWGFMLGVALVDVHFTWRYRETVAEWEMNPVACRAVQWAGVAGAAAYRALWLGFAGAMARTRTRLSWLITPVWGTAHVYLLITLIRAYQAIPTFGW